MKRKLISMICALSMVFSVLGGFSMLNAQAAGEKLTAEAKLENGKVLVDLSYEGMTGGMTTATLFVKIDADKIDTTALNSKSFKINTDDDYISDPTVKDYNYNAEYGFYSISLVYGNETPESGKIGVLTLPLKEGATYPIAIEFDKETSMSDINKVMYKADESADNKLAVVEATVTDPNATPTPSPSPTPKATPTPEPLPVLPTKAPTPEPTATAEPTAAPTAAPLAQNVKADAKLDGSNVVVDLSYEGMTGGMTTATLFVKIDADKIDITKLSAKSFKINADDDYISDPTVKDYNYNSEYGFYSISLVYGTSAPESGKIGVLTLPLKEGATYPIAIEFDKETSMSDNNKVMYKADESADNKLSAIGSTIIDPNAPKPTAAPTPTPSPKPVNEKPVKDVVTQPAKDKIDEIATEHTTDATKSAAITVTFKNKAGSEVAAEYGKDFVVMDSEGKVIPSHEYNNAINGYDPVTLNKIVKGGKFVIYNSSIASISARAVEVTLSPDGETATPSDAIDQNANSVELSPGTTPGRAKWVWNNVKSVTVDKSITLDAVLTDADNVKHSGDEISYSIKSGASYATLDGNKLTGDKKGSVTVEATCGELTSTCTITVNAKKENNKDDSSTGGSGTGAIASGNIFNNAIPGNLVNADDINFTDIWSVQWAEPAITALVKRGVINGRSNTIFDPEANVTRAEFAKMLVSTFGLAATADASSSFADVPSSHWAYNCISIANKLGVITGYDANTFGPNDNITRQDMAVMVYRMINRYNYELAQKNAPVVFSDEAMIADYAKAAVSELQTGNVINGMGDGTFAPTATATRAQAAVILYNFVK